VLFVGRHETDEHQRQGLGDSMQKIGLLGGLSWVSTAEYYRRLNELMQVQLGGVTSPRILLESLNRQAYVDAVITRKDEEAACSMILDGCQSLENGGANFIVISCNDVHRFVPEIAPRIGIPFLHIAEITAQAIVARGIKKVGLLGVMKTMEGAFYPEILAQYGIETIIPGAADKDYIHDRFFDELVMNIFCDTAKAGYLGLIERLSMAGAEGVILGCTEIPLLIQPAEINIPAFATTELHCIAAIDRAIDNDARA
jgi:aspartate racemase